MNNKSAAILSFSLSAVTAVAIVVAAAVAAAAQ